MQNLISHNEILTQYLHCYLQTKTNAGDMTKGYYNKHQLILPYYYDVNTRSQNIKLGMAAGYHIVTNMLLKLFFLAGAVCVHSVTGLLLPLD